MRFLAVTETCDLGAVYLRLAAAGHEVRVAIEDGEAQGTLAGLVEHVANWRAELGWIREAGKDGIVIFEAVSDGLGALQDELRRDGYHVIGGSAFGDRLENDRAFAQEALAALGLKTARVREFTDIASANAFLVTHPGRYVLKFSGSDHASSDNYVGQLEDGRDIRAMLAARLNIRNETPSRFILMDHVEGVEMGVGAYFDGNDFIRPACLDWEHKRFFPGDLGELTGEMGTVATFDRSQRFFTRTLARIAPLLRRHDHVGYVNLNTIVNEEGIWPLEFTCRFGYPGFAILAPLQRTGWAELFRMMTVPSGGRLHPAPGFSAGVVLTTPPFPYSRREIAEAVGLPVLFSDRLDDEDWRHIHYGEVGLKDGQLVTTGLYGWTMVVTGTGLTVPEAKAAAYERIARIMIPNMRYRGDIGDRLIQRDLARVESLGLLGDR